MLQNLPQSSSEWVETVLSDFDAFLLDHAACERKASAMAMSFVMRYPDRTQILDPMIVLAREELTHFHRVFRICIERGLRFSKEKQVEEVIRVLEDHKEKVKEGLKVKEVIQEREGKEDQKEMKVLKVLKVL